MISHRTHFSLEVSWPTTDIRRRYHPYNYTTSNEEIGTRKYLFHNVMINKEINRSIIHVLAQAPQRCIIIRRKLAVAKLLLIRIKRLVKNLLARIKGFSRVATCLDNTIITLWRSYQSDRSIHRRVKACRVFYVSARRFFAAACISVDMSICLNAQRRLSLSLA